MRVFIKENLVDFEAPVYAVPNQRDKIISFLKKNFPEMVIKEVVEPDREYGDRSGTKPPHKWEAKDYLMLFSSMTNQDIADELGLETEMGSHVKRGEFVMRFLKWKQQKGEKLLINEKLIKQFLEEVRL